MTRRIAHVSDLHFGYGRANDETAARQLRMAAAATDHVVVTGDVTHRGRREELALFHEAIGPIAGRVTVVPGNHDRMGDDLTRALMPRRVQSERFDGLYLVRVDSTADDNTSPLTARGRLDAEDLSDVDRALAEAPDGSMVCVLVHHHVQRLPEADLGERLAALLRRTWTHEIAAGAHLLALLKGRCDLVLHGHRHVPSESVLNGGSPRPLLVFNAGSTPRIARFRVFRHALGRLVGAPSWLEDGPKIAAAAFRPEEPAEAAAPAPAEAKDKAHVA